MSEPFLERLTGFTPDAGRLDRDALLFAAGRSSARPNRGWMALTCLLAGTQMLTLALLRPHSSPPAGGLAVPVARVPAPAAVTGPSPSEDSAVAGLWSARHDLLKTATDDRPATDVSFIDSGPPLRALPRPPSLLN
jgi:hypothetical protein